MKNIVKAKWTGGYPNLCSGEWEIIVDDIKLIDSNNLAQKGEYRPKNSIHNTNSILTKEMNTAGSYSSWHFEDWSEVWEDYNDGQDIPEWIKGQEASELIQIAKSCGVQINNDIEFAMALFEAISPEDWRHGSCGGCI